MKQIFITGSNGFVGRHLIKELEKKGLPFIAGTREHYGDLIKFSNWNELLVGCDKVIHLAAKIPSLEETNSDSLEAFRKINTEATLSLARAAKVLRIKRFIYISSVKVNGEETGNLPFHASDKPNPQDCYSISKMEAEAGLLALHEPGVFEVVIIRPTFIYGPGTTANFEKLFWMVKKDLPIPFGRVDNKRSIVSVFNLCDLVILCLDHPKASGEVFLVSDGCEYSLKSLIVAMGKTLGKHPHLLPVPVELMKCGMGFLGKTSYADRLFGNLHVDIEKTKNLLDWKPMVNFEETYNRP